MIFTIISILISIFEYNFSSKFFELESIVIVRFNFESNNLANMKQQQFTSKVIFQKRQMIAVIAKLLKLNTTQIDRLITSQYDKGARFTFLIRIDDTSDGPNSNETEIYACLHDKKNELEKVELH